MNYQSTARNQRTKGLKAKQAFQFGMLLALCIWFLYQFKNSQYKTKGDGIRVQIKLAKEHNAMILGRKGNAVWSSGESDSSYVANIENFTIQKEKQDQKESERQNEPEIHVNDDSGVLTSLDKDMTNEEFSSNGHEHVEQRLRDNEKTEVNEPRKFEEGRTWSLIPRKDEVYKKNNEDKERFEETGNGEIEDGVHRFHDENGVPEDIDNIVESMPGELSADKKIDLLQESKNRITDSMLQEGEEGKDVADTETESKSTVEDLKIVRETGSEIDSRTSLQNYVSSINHTLGEVLGRSIA